MPARAINSSDDIRVWDRSVRVLHWLLVAGVAIAWFSAEYHVKALHVVTGYGLAVVVGARLVWGFTGSHYARFAQFMYSPARTLSYIKSLRSTNPEHYLGHNPLGALMVFALLTALLALVATGLIVLAGIEFEGPLLPIALHFDDDFFYTAKRLHDLLANTLLVLIAAHIGGVVLASRQHQENLVRAMFTGRKKNLVARDAQQYPASPSRESTQ